MKKLLIILIILLIAVPCFAVEDSQINLYIVDQTEDSTGRILVLKIKELASMIKTINLVNENHENRYDIIISSIPYQQTAPDAATVYSVIWNRAVDFDIYYIDSVLGYTPRFSVTDVAIEIFTFTQKIINGQAE